jgi:peroxiredoxin
MRRFLLATTSAAYVVGFAFAGDEKANAKSVPATRLVQAAGGGKSDDDKQSDKKVEEKKAPARRDRLIQLMNENARKKQDLVKAMDGMKPGEERDKAFEKRLEEINNQFAGKALDLAREDAKDEIAFTAAFMAFGSGGGKKMTVDAGDFLLDHFANDRKIVSSIPQIANTNGGLRLLGQLGERSPSKEIRGAARFALLDYEVDRIDYPLLGEPPLPADEAATKFAVATGKLKKLGADFADVNVSTRLGDSVAEGARKKIYFIDNLTVGKKAPDFECELVDGRKAKLSDFRGNVVVLDIWATWCAPCKAMIPHERKLVARMKGKPFKLVSLSVDDEKETLTKFLEAEKMPWTHLWNGASGGFVELYQIQFYPTIYVLDAEGTIRFKHVRSEKMDHAVETLLGEMSRSN